MSCEICLGTGYKKMPYGAFERCDCSAGPEIQTELLEIPAPAIDGKTFDPALDGKRLRSQLGRVYHLMSDGEWRTLGSIQAVVRGSEAAISARLRDLRKPKFGGYTVDRRRVGESGLYEYRLTNV